MMFYAAIAVVLYLASRGTRTRSVDRSTVQNFATTTHEEAKRRLT